jgi:hypothetical protein
LALLSVPPSARSSRDCDIESVEGEVILLNFMY